MPNTIDIDLEEQAAQGICGDYRGIFLKYVRFNDKSRAIVNAAINGAFKADKDTGDLLADKLFYIQVMEQDSYEKRKKDKELMIQNLHIYPIYPVPIDLPQGGRDVHFSREKRLWVPRETDGLGMKLYF